jgi:hypothetical protein
MSLSALFNIIKSLWHIFKDVIVTWILLVDFGGVEDVEIIMVMIAVIIIK